MRQSFLKTRAAVVIALILSFYSTTLSWAENLPASPLSGTRLANWTSWHEAVSSINRDHQRSLRNELNVLEINLNSQPTPPPKIVSLGGFLAEQRVKAQPQISPLFDLRTKAFFENLSDQVERLKAESKALSDRLQALNVPVLTVENTSRFQTEYKNFARFRPAIENILRGANTFIENLPHDGENVAELRRLALLVARRTALRGHLDVLKHMELALKGSCQGSVGRLSK